MTFADGYHMFRLDLGKTDRPVPRSGRRTRIRATIGVEISGGAVTRVHNATLLLGLGNGYSVSVEEVDALLDDMETAKRHRRWREARLVIAPFLGWNERLCVHQLASAEGRQLVSKRIEVAYLTLTPTASKERTNLGGTLVNRLKEEGEVYATDREKLLVKLPSELYLVEGKYLSAALPSGIKLEDFYYKYCPQKVRAVELNKAQVAALPEGYLPDLVCPLCKHRAGDRINSLRNPDFNRGQVLLNLCAHGGERGDYTWTD